MPKVVAMRLIGNERLKDMSIANSSLYSGRQRYMGILRAPGTSNISNNQLSDLI